MSGVRYTLVETNTVDVPGAAAATYNRGFNIPGGPIDEIIMKLSFTMTAAGDLDGDTSNAVSALRLVLNGETIFDYQGLVASAAVATPGTFGYFMNSLGRGRSLDIPAGNLASAADREYYVRIPVGRNAAAGISRLEYTLSYALLTQALAAAGGSIEWWVRYNPAMQTTVTVGNATSFTYTATTQQVVMRVPQNVPGTLAGILIQTNNGTADEIDSIRLVSQSDFSMDVDMWRVLAGDTSNGIEAFIPATAGSQTYFTECEGQYFLPLYNLNLMDDLRMQVTANAGGTLSVTPVITSPIVGKPAPEQVQTQSVPTNVAQAVLDDSAAQV
tara:strand:+ start:1775 stop:2761 length:987 start_codon:yes stop_codon:yes gene_type:complete